MPFLAFLQTAPAASSSQSFLMSVLPFALIILIFYFFIIRPQNRKQKETEKMISTLKKSDRIVTVGGIHGVVSSTKEKTVIIKVDDNTKLEVNRSAIASVITDKPVDIKTGKDKKTEKENSLAEEKTNSVKADEAASTEEKK